MENTQPTKAEQIETLRFRQKRMRAAVSELRKPPVDYRDLNQAKSRLAEVNYQLRWFGRLIAMQQADIRQLQTLLNQYAALLEAEGEMEAVEDIQTVLDYVDKDLRENQP